MKLTYDPVVDAAYLQISEEFDSSRFGFTYACDPAQVGGQINLDFDLHGKLAGIEILQASRKLPSAVISAASPDI